MKKMTLATAGAWWRTAMLAAVSTMALTALANAQSAGDDEAAARVAARYGVMLDTISVYADRNARQALDLPQNVTVIGRQELDERMVRDVQDLVRYEPGITVAKTTSGTDPFGNLAGFTIRGVSNNRVQMLIDGTRVIESIVDGNRDFVNMANLKAVEIIRGPAGVMWGADALGGVVAFVTKDPEDYLKGRKFGGQLDTGFRLLRQELLQDGYQRGALRRFLGDDLAHRSGPTMRERSARRGPTAASMAARAIRRRSAATSSIRLTAATTTFSASWYGIPTKSTR